MHASVRLDHSLVALEGEHDLHAMIEITSPQEAPAAERQPLRLALVVDRSGSMGGRKLEVAKRCAAWLASRLRPEDELALVDFDHDARLLAPLGSARRAEVGRAIERMRAGGSTNLSGGWLKGLEQLRAADGAGPRSILLLSDGHANVGVADPAALASIAGAAARDGIRTSTIGLGRGFDEDLLTAMSDAAGGNAHFAETADSAPGIFAQEVGGLTSVVAQNVSLEIRPADGVEMLSVLNDYPAVAVPGGAQVQLGDAYAGDTRRVVFALRIPHLADLGLAHVADVVLRYVSIGDEIAEHTVALPVTVNAVSASEAASVAPDGAVVDEVHVLRAARARDEAIRLADEGRLDDAQRLLVDTAGEVHAASPALAEEARALLAQSRRLTRDRYDEVTRKKLRYDSNLMRRDRRKG